MSVTTTGPCRVDFQRWSTTVTLVVSEPSVLAVARAVLDDELDAVEDACSRFRSDSEISRLLRNPGVDAPLSPVLNDAIGAALDMAAATSYLVDPTVAAAVIALGYDRDITQLRGAVDRGLQIATGATSSAPGAWQIRHDRERRRITVPAGIGLDLGATAKPLAADRAASRVFARTGASVLVGLGGDIAVAGPAPTGGWSIAIGDDHRTAEAAPDARVAISEGGLATSSISARSWPTSRGVRHHLVDPRTGENPDPYWRTVSVAAASALAANAAATAAIILGAGAPDWLTGQRLPARLVGVDHTVVAVCGWPDEAQAA